MRMLNSRSVSSNTPDDDKENQSDSYCSSSLPVLPIKPTSTTNKTEAQKEASGLGSNNSLIPHSSLEVDEMGLFNLKPRAQDIASIDPKVKVTRTFCEPMVRTVSASRGGDQVAVAGT